MLTMTFSFLHGGGDVQARRRAAWARIASRRYDARSASERNGRRVEGTCAKTAAAVMTCRARPRRTTRPTNDRQASKELIPDKLLPARRGHIGRPSRYR